MDISNCHMNTLIALDRQTLVKLSPTWQSVPLRMVRLPEQFELSLTSKSERCNNYVRIHRPLHVRIILLYTIIKTKVS